MSSGVAELHRRTLEGCADSVADIGNQISQMLSLRHSLS
jgi:hypothetical protein